MSDPPEAESSAHLRSGTVLKDRYYVERELGRGGVGIVYLAHDRQLLDRPVVVKILLETASKDSWVKAKFQQEMEALARIDHPGVVGLLDNGELPDGRLFLVLQFIEGIPLRTLIRPEGMELERVADIIRQAAAALDAAHNRGVLHRDLKPENIMIQTEGSGDQVRLIDFGLAKVLHSRVAESTAVPNVAGTYGYMSPEQLMARPVTPAGDVFSLAVIAYEMVTGRRPHNPESMFQLLEMLRGGIRVMPVDLRPSLPMAAQEVLLRALSFDPEHRPARASVFGEALASALQALPAAATSSTVPPAPQPGPVVSASIHWITLLACELSIVVFARASCFRFESWSRMFSNPLLLGAMAICLLGLVILSRRLRREGRPGGVPLLFVWLLSGALFLTALTGPPVLTAAMESGTPSSLTGFTLNYSDPRGFRYTVQENSYFVVRVSPGRLNRIREYRLQLILAPEVEFLDVYLDRGFGITEQLSLQPSVTNDMIQLERDSDDFARPRAILFTCKSRTPPDRVRFHIVLRTPGRVDEYDF